MSLDGKKKIMNNICQICKTKKVITDSEIILDNDGITVSYTNICLTCTDKIKIFIEELVPKNNIELFNERFTYFTTVFDNYHSKVVVHDTVKNNTYSQILSFIPNEKEMKEVVLSMIKEILERDNTDEYTSE